MESESLMQLFKKSVCSMDRSSWDELPSDVVDKVLKKIDKPKDLLNFGAVCKPWHSAVLPYTFFLPCSLHSSIFLPLQPPFPVLLLASVHSGKGVRTHCLYSILERKVYDGLYLPELNERSLCGSTNGLLVTVSRRGKIHLLDPLTRKQTSLPPAYAIPKSLQRFMFGPLNYKWMNKVIACQDPVADRRYCLLFATDFTYSTQLHYLKIREEKRRWEELEPRLTDIEDIISYQGLLYVVNTRGSLFSIDINAPEKVTMVVDSEKLGMPVMLQKTLRNYLVESSGELLLVMKPNFPSGQPAFFKVFKLGESDVSYRGQYYSYDDKLHEQELRHTWVEVQNLQGQMLFLGLYESISLNPSLYPGSKGNCMYFFEYDSESHIHVGIFHMEDQRTEYFEGLDNAPSHAVALWLSPNACVPSSTKAKDYNRGIKDQNMGVKSVQSLGEESVGEEEPERVID